MSKKNVAKSQSVKSAKSKGAKKAPVQAPEFGRVARVLGAPNKTLAPLDSLGAFGGRGARTARIENVIAKSGAKGASIREIEAQTQACAVAMHVRTLYTGGARKHRFIDRKYDEKRGALVYFALKRPIEVKRVSTAK